MAGSLRWTKVDGAGQPLGGATFQVCRTLDRFGAAVSGECQSVADNGPADSDPAAGAFRLSALALGTFSVQETAAPAGYNLDTTIQTAATDLTTPNGVIAPPFVNVRPATGQLAPTQTTCQDYQAGSAANQTEALYGVKNGLINNVAPGVFFYYSRVTAPAASFTIQVQQTGNFTPLFAVQNNNQVRLYNADCSVSAQLAGYTAANGQAALNVSGAAPGQVFVVSIKYDASSVSGQPAPSQPLPAPVFKLPSPPSAAARWWTKTRTAC